MSHSAKKVFTGVLQLQNLNNEEITNFAIFKDSDIGIHEYWQANQTETVKLIFLIKLHF